MRILLDTHALVWMLEGDPQLSPQALADSRTLASRDTILDAYGVHRLW